MDLSNIVILVVFLNSDTQGLDAPRYVSDWFDMDVDDISTCEHTWTHGFGVVPYMHEVQMRSSSGFIYPGIKSGDGDNDNDMYRGGVICIYNANDVMVFSAVQSSTNAKLVYTGTTSYTNQNQESSTVASVRVRLWHPDDFPAPTQTLTGIDLTAGDSSNNYETHAHSLGQVPQLTVVQLQFTYDGATWYGEGTGSSRHIISTYVHIGGVVFGVDDTDIRLWAPRGDASYDYGVINMCDGWGHYTTYTDTGCAPHDASVTIRLWADLGSISILDQTTSHSLSDSADSHAYPISSTFDVDTDLVIVESVAVDGTFAGHHFYAVGAAYGDGISNIGGMVYGYSTSEVRLWHPITSGYLIKIGRDYGTTSGYTHLSTQTQTIIRIWKGGASCTALSSITTATMTANETTTVYTCKQFYTLATGDLVRQCQANATWSGTAPSCERCDSIDASENAVISAATLQDDNVVEFDCLAGHTLISGNLQRSCQSTGSGVAWSGTSPICQSSGTAPPGTTPAGVATTCSVPDDGINTELSVGSITIGSFATYTCVVGYSKVSGTLSRQCLDNGSQTYWSGTIPHCELTSTTPVECPYPESGTNTVLTVGAITEGSQVTYTCTAGYSLLSGDQIHTCQNDATWDGTVPECQILCDDPDSNVNTNVILSSSVKVIGTSATYSCGGGFVYSSGDMTRVCYGISAWTGTAPTCIAAGSTTSPTSGPSTQATTTSSGYVCFNLSATGGDTAAAERIAEEIVANLTVPVKSTAMYIRSLTSAQDSRTSSLYIGILGSLFCSGIFVLMIASDLASLARHLFCGDAVNNELDYDYNSF